MAAPMMWMPGTERAKAQTVMYGIPSGLVDGVDGVIY